jgi:hypothetical protein
VQSGGSFSFAGPQYLYLSQLRHHPLFFLLFFLIFFSSFFFLPTRYWSFFIFHFIFFKNSSLFLPFLLLLLIYKNKNIDLISTISDPEHPLSLGSLAVVSLPDIHIARPAPPPRRSRSSSSSSHRASPPVSTVSTVTVLITPTITHCSLATVIGLGVRVRLEQALPPRFRVDVRIKDGTHSTGAQVTKQLNDKERVAAALENASLMSVINKMLETCR